MSLVMGMFMEMILGMVMRSAMGSIMKMVIGQVRRAVVMSDTSNRYSDQISVVSRIAKSSGSGIGSLRL